MSEPEMNAVPEIGGGTYEVIRKRLTEQATRLRATTDHLNARRQEIFGASTTALLATVRVRTEHNCVPRDIIRIRDDSFLLGYQVHMGLKSETAILDVFTKLRIDGDQIVSDSFQLLLDPRFQKDFSELFKYYKDARLLQLRRTDSHLLMVFQTGQKLSDIRVLRWGIKGNDIAYLDNRGERDHTFPPAHDFAWVRTTREDQVLGLHPHVNICDTIFVETIEGDLTIKVEDNTDSGTGIYAEDVDDANQSLDDADIYYANLENTILLKIKPYREDDYRYIVYNKQTQEAQRLDAIGCSCQQLPEGHGLIFPNGYYLQNGSSKVFPYRTDDMEFINAKRSPNGEDVAYLFHHREEGTYAILHYNLITREVTTPQICNGYTLTDDGRMILFRSEKEPARVHAMQIWQTPFYSEEFAAAHPRGDGSHLGTIGNRELVRAVSDLLQIGRLITNQQPNRVVYEELLRAISRVIDSYYWLDHAEAFGLREQLQDIQRTANNVIDEFEKVVQLRQQATVQLQQLEAAIKDLFKDINYGDFQTIDDYVSALDRCRAQRGTIDAARDIHYIDLAGLDQLDQRIATRGDQLAERAITFLLNEAALTPYHEELAAILDRSEEIHTTNEADPLQTRLDELGRGLDLLMEIVNTLAIADSTQRTDILERISEVYGQLNRARALLQNRRKELGSREGCAEFGAQFKLLSQSVANYLGLCDNADKCDDFLAKLMVQVEELEGRFIDFADFTDQLVAKREEIYDSFNTRRQQLLDERQRHADGLGRAAGRILTAIAKRALSFSSDAELGAYFASDPMVMKAKAIIGELTTLGDTVKADDIQSRLKSAREDAVRHLRDQSELFDESGTVQLGRHRFSVNKQTLDLTMLRRDDGMYLHLTGSDFFERIADEEFQTTEAFWNQDLVSENAQVYRAEYLAHQIITAAEDERDDLDLARLHEAARDQISLRELVRSFAAQRYDEGYERGIHDHDCVLILQPLLHMRDTAGLLRFSARARSVAIVVWTELLDDQTEAHWRTRARSLIRLRDAFGARQPLDALADEIDQAFIGAEELLGEPIDPGTRREAARYLLEEMGRDDQLHFVVAGEAEELAARFRESLGVLGLQQQLDQERATLEQALPARFRLLKDWLRAWCAKEAITHPPIHECALLLAYPDLPREAVHARAAHDIDGLLGDHQRITSGGMRLELNDFSQRLGHFASVSVPAYRAYQDCRRALLARERKSLRLDEFTPRVLTSFVRNRLINEVYLPLIGDNLAKQIGAVGDTKRTDLMGMLLLISPPGYGKTTLMEYLASVLGLTFMKINGPAIGHQVQSLDPAEAPHATARQELIKLNLALEMGNNVMLYLDDIQHCNPELLQKFISLCDGQRRIEGVWRNRSRTYDLRGKKVAVVMAGNPYTESGAKFQIPDMLANRADTYNLGDILGGAREAFELSYLENCLSVNPTLAPLASRSREDFARLLRIADGDEEARSALEHPYSALELEEITAVLRHLRRIQQVLLQVNQEYIRSASINDDFRTEPSFKLQGSYRNMSKLAEKVVPVMNDQELEQLILDHYLGESQTLTAAAEANLLKFRLMCGFDEGQHRERWREICTSYTRKQELGSAEDDPMQHALLQLIKLNEGLGGLQGAIEASADRQPDLRPILEALTSDRRSEHEQKIEIVNTFPRYYGKLYEQNIQTIERSLAPAVSAIAKHLDHSDEVRESLRELIEHLRQMALRNKNSAVYDKDHQQQDDDDPE